MQWPDLRFGTRHLVIGVAVSAVGLCCLRANWDRANVVILRRYSEDWRPWNRGDEIRVRLDADRLRAHGLSKDDVIRALTPSSLFYRKEPPPPPGVVFVSRVSTKPDQYGGIVLKATAEGKVVRLEDVAKIEASR